MAEHVSPGDVLVSKGAATTASGKASAASPTAREWTVQVASYESLDEAQNMQRTLCERGYDARIVGAGRPYGVRVGRYPSSKAAIAVARRLTSRHLTVFVTGAE